MTAPNPTLTVRWTGLADPLVRPLLDELAHEYATRYEGILAVDQIRDELEHYPAAEFASPDGALVLLLEDGEPVAGGAFRRRVEPELGDADRRPRAEGRDESGVPTVPTAELKRIWTDSAHRRQGLAKKLLTELETDIAGRGYTRIYLTTGDRQPEAERLYESAGYTRLAEPLPAEGEVYPMAFQKVLT